MRRFVLMSSLLLVVASPAMAAQVYKWVDEKGVTHFSAQPPEGTNAAAINTNTAPPKATFPLPPAPAPQPPRDDKQKAVDEKVRRDVARQEAERSKYCAGLRNNLAQLKNNPRVRIEENGEMRRIPEEERQARIVQAERDIRENCD
ncbi:DUF4124 domain-containing protein [Pseudomonas jinjuensis]|uniref:DUF4124 domain-containing protein n=1 Tax=Pseudomonas jinjuensis TaxID=198616 RepID=A0A1H0GQV1_9PSED|nr:DUF4124 domain-containing protein [Pseudomonas jinjuensis]SDO09283.1 protein of unknown function [Pseudomonas jinjuensis]